MTVPVQTPINSYVYAGSPSFIYSFQLLAATDLLVTVDGVVKTLGVDYTVAGVGVQAGGTIAYLTPITTGQLVSLSRQTTVGRATDYQTLGDFLAGTINNDFDRLWMALQERVTNDARSVRAPVGETLTPLPPAAQRANQILSFDGSGNPIAVAPASGSATALAINLADGTVPNHGAGMLAYNPALTYPAGSIGLTVANLLSSYPGNLEKVANDLKNGTAVTIACFGDSTMWGADPANIAIQVAETPPQALQATLRKYFGNTAATVTNNAISGTTSDQMLLGTDGSGSTFLTKMAASSAAVVYCNHGINDALGTVGNTTPLQYKANLVTFIKICRLYGKIPVLVTPNPNWSIGGRAQSRAEPVKLYASIMRHVAEEFAVALVDNFDWVQRQLASGKVLTQALLGDGIHPTAACAAQNGRNLAIPLAGQVRAFSAPDQFQAAAEPVTQLSTVTLSEDTGGARLGSFVGTQNTGAAQSIRFLVLVQEPGLDLYLSAPIVDAHSDIVTIGVDENYSINSWSQFHAGFPSAGTFIQDYETCFMEDVLPGLHLIEMTCSSVALGMYHVRSRAKLQPNTLKTSGTNMRNKKLWLDSVEHNSTVGDAYLLFDEFPTSHLLHNFECEWTSQMPKQSGVVIGGFTFSNNSGPMVPRAGFIVALDNTGFLTIYEASGPTSYTSTALGAVDLSVASHKYRTVIGSGRFGTIDVYVDDTKIGATYNITRPFWGGRLGLWKFPNTGNLKVDKLYYVTNP